MATGLAGALLVFTGIWHAFEWAMGGRNRDTARLVPVGVIHTLLGCFIVTGTFMPWAAWIALVLTTLGMIAAFSMRHTAMVRKWVTWAFIIIDVVIVLALIAGLLG